MKIIKVVVFPSEVRFVFEEFPKSAFVVDLTNKLSQKEITDELKIRFNEKLAKSESLNSFDVKNLEGVDINA